LTGDSGRTQPSLLERPFSNIWEIFPTFRIAERVPAWAFMEEWLISAVFGVWHAHCSVWGNPDDPGKTSQGSRSYQMSVFENASNRALAAVFALSVSAMFMAAAIVPASPAGLIA
jgi:hypothetical protein